jgi:glyoxylase I family protein
MSDDCGMEIRGLTYVGSMTTAQPEMARFVADVLGLAPMPVEGSTAVFFTLPDGSSMAVAGADGLDERTVGFLVDDVDAAAIELRAAGVETDEATSANSRYRYLHFRAPDGKLYELVEDLEA